MKILRNLKLEIVQVKAVIIVEEVDYNMKQIELQRIREKVWNLS